VLRYVTGAKPRRIGVALVVLAGLLAGCADIDDGDTGTAERPMADRARERGTQGGERSRKPERRAGKPERRAHKRERGAGDDRDRPRLPIAVITRVVDGDTVELDNGETVRLIGIDTPEVYGGAECGGARASAYMERIATGRRVSVRTDPTQDTYDRYERLLAYLDAGGTDLGEAVLRAGWARVYVYDEPFGRLAAYRRAATTARGGDRGIWASC
jgi:endonuclease YncB( thermonuclease family)